MIDLGYKSFVDKACTVGIIRLVVVIWTIVDEVIENAPGGRHV